MSKSSFMSPVWGRKYDDTPDTMSKNLYAFAVAGFTFLGIFASLGAAQFTLDLKFSSGWDLLWFCLAGLAVAIVGAWIAMKSDNPLVSLFGYALVAIPVGLMLGPVVAMYTTASVIKVFFVTTVIVAALGVVGAAIPEKMEGFGSWSYSTGTERCTCRVLSTMLSTAPSPSTLTGSTSLFVFWALPATRSNDSTLKKSRCPDL